MYVHATGTIPDLDKLEPYRPEETRASGACSRGKDRSWAGAIWAVRAMVRRAAGVLSRGSPGGARISAT
jgi:hypothetical protein